MRKVYVTSQLFTVEAGNTGSTLHIIKMFAKVEDAIQLAEKIENEYMHVFIREYTSYVLCEK